MRAVNDAKRDEASGGEDAAWPARWLVGLVVAFGVIHAGYYAAGVRFDRTTLIEVMHFLDPELLRTRLLESLLYLHIQPPLMNFFTGLVLKITPESAALFHAIFLIFGLTLCLALFLLQRRLGVAPGIAAALALLFAASPSFILFEHFLFYTLPLAALLAVAALALWHAVETRRTLPIVVFLGVVFLLCGTRSMFHWVYFLAVWCGIAWAVRSRWRVVLVAGLLPFLVLMSFYAKNAVLFGEFTVSTIAPKNLWIMTAGNLGWEEKTQLIAEGKLSPLSATNRWAHLDAYPPEYHPIPAVLAGIPAVAAAHKSTGAVNYNHAAFIDICKVYGEDARWALFHRPKAFVYALATSWYRYFKSSGALPVSLHSQAHMQPMQWLYDHVFYGKLPFDLAPYSRLVDKGGNPPYLFLIFGLPALFCFGVYRLLWRPPPTPADRALLAYLLFNIAFVAVLGCTFDFHETARYRFKTDAFSLVLLGLVVQGIAARRRAI